MKRATLLLEDAIYQRVKHLSQKQGSSLKEVINDLLRRSLNQKEKKRAIKFEIPLHKGNGPRSGIDIADRNTLYDLMEDRF